MWMVNNENILHLGKKTSPKYYILFRLDCKNIDHHEKEPLNFSVFSMTETRLTLWDQVMFIGVSRQDRWFR